MPTEYLPILLYMALAAAITLVLLLGNRILGAISRPMAQKQMPYESGIRPVGSARERFHIRYHVIAMIFLIFDLEIAFIYPWAVLYKQLGWPGFIEMMVFLGILLIGFLYAWKRGAFQWE
jgi:NADH-quinone oxidoreductase subunit A